jgi:hypothetical protein
MYLMDGSVKTMNSTWNGPPGQMVRSLGKCFHPFTAIKLKNGSTKSIKNIDLGDVLEDGSIVESVLKIDNKINKEPFYIIRDADMDIYVTGSHLIYDASKNTFVKVKDYHKATLSNIRYDWFSCLITDTHRIPIGTEIFWDWEDHFVKIKV